MELLDRYLQAVKKYLPLRRQDDILAELRANLESQLEDKEAERQRPLTASEMEEWLRTLGPPIMVASRYMPQRYLIGPTIFPIYWYVLRIALLWATIIYTVVCAVVIPLTSPNPESVVGAFLRIPLLLFNVAALVTLVFVIFDFVSSRYPGKCPPIAGFTGQWNPGMLPPLEKQSEAGPGSPRSFAKAVAEVIFGALAFAWLLLIPHYPYLLFGPGAYFLKNSPFQLAPIWWTFYWCILALNIVQLVWHTVRLIRGTWQQRRFLEYVVVKVLAIIPPVVLLSLRGHQYLLLKNPAPDQARFGVTVDTLNNSIHLGFMVICAIVVLQLLWDIGQFIWKAYQEREANR